MQLFGRRKDAQPQDPYEKQRKQAVEAQRSAMLFLQGKLYGQAESELRRAVALDPDSVTAHAYLGMVLHKIGRLDEAVDELGIAINLMPDDEALWRTRGSVKEALDDVQGAIIDYQMALQLDTGQPLSHAALGGIMVRTGDMQRADFHLRRALELEPRDPVALADLAQIRQQQGAQSEAIAALRGALTLLADRDHPPVVRTGGMPVPADTRADITGRLQARLGLLLESTSDASGAVAALHAAHEAIPDDTTILREYARLLIQLARLTEALALYERTEKAFPANRGVYESDLAALVASHRGPLLDRPASPPVASSASTAAASASGGDQLARLEAQVRADSTNRVARRELSVAYLRAGRIAEAKEQARIAEELRSHRTGGAEQPA
jgi:tetratricopeptide (TPR) repeat protein